MATTDPPPPPDGEDARLLSQRDLRRVLGSLRDVLVLTDAELCMTFVSPSVETVLGYPPATLLGRSILDLLHPEELPIAAAHAATRFSERQGRTLTHRTLHADGRVRYLESMIEVLEEDGAWLGVVFNARDVTERIMEQAWLEREVAFSRSLVALTNELLAARLDARFHQHALERAIALVPDAQGGSMLLRDGDDGRFGYVAAVGYDLGKLRKMRLSERELARSDPPRVERIRVAQQIAQLGPEPLALLRDAGRLDAIRATLCVPIVVAGTPRGYLNLDNFEDGDVFGDGVHAIATAISAQVAVALQRLTLEDDLQRERERYERLAAHDPLTGLPNRRLFQDRLEQALAQAQRGDRALAVAYVDLDGFKAVNDARGHDAGDAALVAVGRRLAGAVRGQDTVARLGGDEFGVLLLDVGGVDEAAAVATKLRAAVRAPLELEGGDAHIDASVGVALFPDHGGDADALMRAADGAMYHVKGQGRGGVRLA
ncbi:MAG: diguanylate cyclase domain-containing protein [Trueperaceae bacterium]